MWCHLLVKALVQPVDCLKCSALHADLILNWYHVGLVLLGKDELHVAVGDILLTPCQGHRFDHAPRVVGALRCLGSLNPPGMSMTARAYFGFEALVKEGAGCPDHPSLPEEVASTIISAKTVVAPINATGKPFTTASLKEMSNVLKRSLVPSFTNPRPFPVDVGLGILVEGVFNEVSSLPTAVGSQQFLAF